MPARHSLPFEKGPKETEGLHFRDFLLFGKHFQHSVSKLSADLWGGSLIQMRKENVKPEHTPSSNHNKINTISFSLLIFCKNGKERFATCLAYQAHTQVH